MRVILKAPDRTGYHDNTTWVAMPVLPSNGIWLKPGQMLAVIDRDETVSVKEPEVEESD